MTPINHDNPYAPPATIDSRQGIVRSFQIGNAERFVIVIEASFWTGLKTRAVDSSGVTGPTYRGDCRFDVGETEVHDIEIGIDRWARLNLYVDGELLEGNLLARQRLFIFACVAFITILIFAMIASVFAFFEVG